jgi:hypothetical protein
MLGKVATESNLSDTPGNICNIDESGMQINNKPDAVITDKGSKNIHVLTSGEKSENVTVIACCNAAGQFLLPVVIFKGVKHGSPSSVSCLHKTDLLCVSHSISSNTKPQEISDSNFN